MAEVLFINDQYLKKYTQVNGSVDPNLIYPSIIIAQEKFVMPYLGGNLYDKLKSDIENNTLSGNYEILLENYVRRVVLWYVMVELYPFLTYKIDNGSLVQRTMEDGDGVADQTMKEFIQRALNNAIFYRDMLTDYLCANSNLFPEYSNNVFPSRAPIRTRNVSGTYMISGGNTATSRTSNYKRLDQLP